MQRRPGSSGARWTEEANKKPEDANKKPEDANKKPEDAKKPEDRKMD